MDLKEKILSLASMMTITGYETYEKEKLKIFEPYFDSHYEDNLKNQIFVKKCTKENAPKLMIDAHLDEVGLYVTDILDNGFLKVTNIGGIDTAILWASDFYVYGKDGPIYAVVSSIPPHLSSKAGSANALPKIDEIVLDTGYSKETLQKLIRVGTPVGFYPNYFEMSNNVLVGKGFDDKACGAIAIDAVSRLKKEEMEFDVYVVLSVKEETRGQGGSIPASRNINPDLCICVDVNFAKQNGVRSKLSSRFGDGFTLTLSSIVDQKLTKMSKQLADEKNIKCVPIVSASRTSTNAQHLQIVDFGIPTIDIGLPIKSMHTMVEALSMDDANSLSDFIYEFIKSKDIANEFDRQSEVFF